MNTHSMTNDERSWSWRRVGAWSGCLSVHAIAIALLALPVTAALTVRHERADPTLVVLADPPPPTLPEPPPPVPPAHVRVPPKPVPRVVAPVVATPVTPQTPVSVATANVEATPNAPTSTPASDGDGDATAAGGANQTLAYEGTLNMPYPLASAHAREQGTVLLHVLVDASGAPQRVDIARSSGHPRLDAAARDAVMHARFRPVLRDGHAISAWGLLPIDFRLANG